jgi:hypothetical protein
MSVLRTEVEQGIINNHLYTLASIGKLWTIAAVNSPYNTGVIRLVQQDLIDIHVE